MGMVVEIAKRQVERAAECGPTLRDRFAMSAMVGLATWVADRDMTAAKAAERCYEIADAMLAAREVGDEDTEEAESR